MRAERKDCHAAAMGFCVLLTVAAPVLAQAPPAARGSPDHMLFLPVIYAELAGRN